jgi:hypothetical protein
MLAAPVDRWTLRLERVRGKIGDDGIDERNLDANAV